MRAGARVRRWAYRFDVKQPPRRHLHLVDAFDAASLEGRALVGAAPIECVDGEVTRCTLAEPITLAGVALPAGCALHAGGLELVVTNPVAYVHDGRVIAPPVHPATNLDLAADVGGGDLAAVMSAHSLGFLCCADRG